MEANGRSAGKFGFTLNWLNLLLFQWETRDILKPLWNEITGTFKIKITSPQGSSFQNHVKLHRVPNFMLTRPTSKWISEFVQILGQSRQVLVRGLATEVNYGLWYPLIYRCFLMFLPIKNDHLQ